MSEITCWGSHNLHARKEEFCKQIKAFIDDQMSDMGLRKVAVVLGVSHPTVRRIKNGEFAEISLDTFYTIAMNLQMGPCVTIPEYGSYMG